MQIIEDAPIISLTNDSSMDDIRNLVVDGKEPEPKEPAKEPEAKEPDAGTGDVKTEEEVIEEPEVELPRGVQKRIEKEVERRADIQRRIDEAVSQRKAKEAELAALTAEPGTDPKTPKADENARPEPPDVDNFEGTLAELKVAIKEYAADDKAWLEKQTYSVVERKFQEKQAEEAAKTRWDSAVKEHGDKWEPSVKTVSATAPEALQIAISALDNWSKVAVHLADNPATLAALVEQFKAQPLGSHGHMRAIAQLGRLEEKITSTAKETTKEPVKIPPAPLKKIAAEPSESEGEFDPDKANMTEISSWMRKRKLV